MIVNWPRILMEFVKKILMEKSEEECVCKGSVRTFLSKFFLE